MFLRTFTGDGIRMRLSANIAKLILSLKDYYLSIAEFRDKYIRDVSLGEFPTLLKQKCNAYNVDLLRLRCFSGITKLPLG